jgi:hypothetical protein
LHWLAVATAKQLAPGMQHAPGFPHGLAVVLDPQEVLAYQTFGERQLVWVVMLQLPVVGSQHAPCAFGSGQTTAPAMVQAPPR